MEFTSIQNQAFQKKFSAGEEVITVNIFEQIMAGQKPDPNAPQQGQPQQPGQTQVSPAQQKLAGMVAQKEKEAAGLKAQQIALKQKDLDKEKAVQTAQAKAQMAKPDQQTQGIGGGQQLAMKNESLPHKEVNLIDAYQKTLKLAEKTLAEQESMSQRQIQPEQYRNDPDEMGETDDVSAVKNKTILKHLGHEVGKDDQVHRAERIISKFEKIIPKLKQAIQTIRHRIMQNEYGRQAGMNMADSERSEIEDKERKRHLAAAMRNK